ncbi:MAG: SUMF1/EgtB/PvdO family nonheme iron enzyme [Deltaproteobacteria bacterium]|nr:SUMF1/EgtB/PvdO family nonheme iron enzyme [Deltaproteobacteria bacterium]
MKTFCGESFVGEPRKRPSPSAPVWFSYVIIAVLFCVAFPSCIPHAEYGDDGQRCFENGTCLTGLVCSADNVCVRLETIVDAGAGRDGGVLADVGDADARDGETEWVPPDGVLPDGGPDSGDDSGVDGSIDIGSDGGTDTGTELLILSIEGTGETMPADPRSEDQAFWTQHSGDRVSASKRISSVEKAIFVGGLNLSGVEAAQLKGQTGQGDHDMVLVSKTAATLTLSWPTILLQGGLFDLVLTGTNGTATAHVYFMQGEPGDPGPSIFTCNGETCAAGKNLTIPNLTVTGSYILPDCPEGYTKDARSDIVLCKNGLDEMVKVGDFWIDRYEAIVVDEATWNGGNCDGAGNTYGAGSDNWSLVSSSFPFTGNFAAKLYSCSMSGVTPSRWMTWFQAQEAAAASGKRLCTNEEWQAAVAGTFDPGANPGGAGSPTANTKCLTDASGPRATGLAGSTVGGNDSCISAWGAEDMIGNLYEWVAMWGESGKSDASYSSGAYAGTVGSGQGWDGFSPETSGDGDGTWNLNGEAFGGDRNGVTSGVYKTGLAFAAPRGGSWVSGPQAGVFTMILKYAPSYRTSGLGFRGCRGR